jgi:hypothetical protein
MPRRFLALLLLLTLSAFAGCNSSCGSKSDQATPPPAGLAGTKAGDAVPDYNEQSHQALADAKKQRPIITGRVLEVISKESFSYLRVQPDNAPEEWFAVLNSKAAPGQTISIEEQAVLTDFHSKSLDRTFAKIIFGSVVAKK